MVGWRHLQRRCSVAQLHGEHLLDGDEQLHQGGRSACAPSAAPAPPSGMDAVHRTRGQPPARRRRGTTAPTGRPHAQGWCACGRHIRSGGRLPASSARRSPSAFMESERFVRILCHLRLESAISRRRRRRRNIRRPFFKVRVKILDAEVIESVLQQA